MAGLLDLFGGGGGFGGGGMLDQFLTPEMKQQMAQKRMMGFAQGLLKASGPSRMPVGFGQALAGGMEGAQASGGEDDFLKQLTAIAALKTASKPDYQKVGAGETLYDPATGKEVFKGPPKEQWEEMDIPGYGKMQKNTVTGEVKQVPYNKDLMETQTNQGKAAQVKQSALDVANRLLKNADGVRANRGGVSTLFPNVRDSSVNAAADLETLASLLTTENLGLLKGVLSDTDMRVLKDIGAGGLKGADEQVLANLTTIRDKLMGEVPPIGSALPPPSGASGIKFLGFE